MDFSIEKMQLGDENAFKGFFNEFYQTLCLFANTYVVDQDLAADIVQETFIKVWDKRRDFDSLFKIKSFLYTVVRNACLNKLRENKNRRISLEEVDEQTFFRNTLIENEAYRIFYQAVEALPAQTRKIIELALDGKKNAEIAVELHIQESSVLTLKKHAYRKLRKLLGDYYYLLFIFLYKNL